METKEEKKMKTSKIKPVILDVGADLDAREMSGEDIYEYVRDIKKFKQWFDFFPFIWLSSEESRLKVGTVMQMHGGVPPAKFLFTLTIVELKDHYLKATVSGDFYGITEIYVEDLGDITHFQKNFRVCADSQKALDNYAIGASKFHGKYVRWRVRCLRKLILKAKKKKIQENR